jgi:hypothetical protein
MLLLTVSSPPGTASAVPRAMVKPFLSNRITQICAQVCEGILWGLSATPEGRIMTLRSRIRVPGARQLPDPANGFPK